MIKELQIRVLPQQAASEKELIRFVAVDNGIGAGIGEDVIIVQGSSARAGMGKDDVPVDALIVGILDKEQGNLY